MQGVLNVENETPFKLSPFVRDEEGTIQTKKAQFFREYRRKPEVNARINQQRRKNREMKKQQEMGNLSCMFEETGAAPAKIEPQPIENVSSNSDTSSISDGAPLARGSEGLLRPSRCMDRLTSKQTLFDCTQFDPPASTSLTHAERSDA